MHNNIYDVSFTGIGSGMYRTWVGIADEKVTRPARLENWPLEDLVSYVGGPYLVNNN